MKTGLRQSLAYRCGMIWLSQFKRIFLYYFNQYALSTHPLSLLFLVSSFLNKCINTSENLDVTHPQLVCCEREQMKSWHLLLQQCQNSVSIFKPLSVSVWSAALRDPQQDGRFNLISGNMLISTTSFQKCSSSCAPLFKILVMSSFFVAQRPWNQIIITSTCMMQSVDSVMSLLRPLQFGCDQVFLNWQVLKIMCLRQEFGDS